MTNDLLSIGNSLNALNDSVQKNYWIKGDFWIGTFFGIAGLCVGGLGVYYSVKAFKEARAAKHAANKAGNTVRIQTITIELSDILPKLDKLQPEIKFNEARDLLNEITRRLRRISSPYENEPGLCEKISSLREALDGAKASLSKVRPTDATKEDVPGATYFAIESDFATITNTVADLLGLFEKRTINLGNDDANRTNY